MKKSEANIEDLRNQTVSWGTHRPDDLIPKFMAVLKEYGKEAYDKYVSENPEVEDWKMLDDETKGWVVDELFDLLDGIAPEDCYFGAHPGDGADFGFWQVDESKKSEADESAANTKDYIPNTDSGFHDVSVCIYAENGKLLYRDSSTSFKNAKETYRQAVKSALDTYNSDRNYAINRNAESGKEWLEPYRIVIFTTPAWEERVYDTKLNWLKNEKGDKWDKLALKFYNKSKATEATAKAGFVLKESKKSEKGNKDIFTLDLTRIDAEGDEEGLDDMQAAQNFYDEDEAIQAAKDLADSYKDDDGVVQVTVLWAQEKPNGDIVDDWFDIFTASSSDSATTAKYREMAGYAKTDGLDYYAKGGTSEGKQNEGWSGGFGSRQEILDLMDGGILNKDWNLEKRFGNWGCYVNQNTGRPIVLQMLIEPDNDHGWAYKPVFSDMGPYDINIQAAKWLKPRLEKWVEENPDKSKDVPSHEWEWIEKCLGKETANKDRKNLVQSLVKGDKIKLIDTVANGAVVTFIDMITPSKMRILHNGREMSCRTSYIDRKVDAPAESKKSESTENTTESERISFIKDLANKLGIDNLEENRASAYMSGWRYFNNDDEGGDGIVLSLKAYPWARSDQYATIDVWLETGSGVIDDCWLSFDFGGDYKNRINPNTILTTLKTQLHTLWSQREGVAKKSESLTLKQKELKDLVRLGEAEDITAISDAEAKELKKKGVETIGVSRGIYGMNGALLRDYDGKKYAILARNGNLFYFV